MDDDETEEPSNWDRADRAAVALAAYHDEVQGCEPGLGESYGNEGEGVFEEAFADLLTDLMHLASRAGLEFEELTSRALVNYEAERDEEDDDDGEAIDGDLVGPLVAVDEDGNVTAVVIPEEETDEEFEQRSASYTDAEFEQQFGRPRSEYDPPQGGWRKKEGDGD